MCVSVRLQHSEGKSERRREGVSRRLVTNISVRCRLITSWSQVCMTLLVFFLENHLTIVLIKVRQARCSAYLLMFIPVVVLARSLVLVDFVVQVHEKFMKSTTHLMSFETFKSCRRLCLNDVCIILHWTTILSSHLTFVQKLYALSYAKM